MHGRVRAEKFVIPGCREAAGPESINTGFGKAGEGRR